MGDAAFCGPKVRWAPDQGYSSVRESEPQGWVGGWVWANDLGVRCVRSAVGSSVGQGMGGRVWSDTVGLRLVQGLEFWGHGLAWEIGLGSMVSHSDRVWTGARSRR